jgi:mannose-1-phosphate guanylyltransferase/phosphomannomutase
MKAIIMAGGEGTRLRPILPDLPKPMAPLLGKPAMQRIIELLAQVGVTDICVTLRYMPEKITSYFGDGERFGVKLRYKIEDTPLGTAGSVAACRDFYGSRDFLVVSGDCACDFDLRELEECHRRHGNAATMALYEYDDPLRYGLVLTDASGVIKSFIEKPDCGRVVTHRVNTGIYMLSTAAMELVPVGVTFDFAKELFPLLLKRGERLMGLPFGGYWCDIGTPRAYYQCNLDAMDGKLKIFGGRPETPDSAAKTKSDFPAAGRVTVNCRDRARLMRRLSETLMEAGADFSDGLSVSTGRGNAKIRALGDRSAIAVDSDEPMLRDYLAALARSFDTSSD